MKVSEIKEVKKRGTEKDRKEERKKERKEGRKKERRKERKKERKKDRAEGKKQINVTVRPATKMMAVGGLIFLLLGSVVSLNVIGCRLTY